MKLEEADDVHPADLELDTGVFKNVAEEYIAATTSKPPTTPPSVDFTESEAMKSLTATQSEVQQRLQNIMFLTRPPTFPGDHDE